MKKKFQVLNLSLAVNFEVLCGLVSCQALLFFYSFVWVCFIQCFNRVNICVDATLKTEIKNTCLQKKKKKTIYFCWHIFQQFYSIGQLPVCYKVIENISDLVTSLNKLLHLLGFSFDKASLSLYNFLNNEL